MKDQFVPYDIALKLKELGFNDECFGYYIECEKWIPASYSMEGVEYPSNNDLILDWVTSPLYQQVFQFLRDNFNFSGNIDCCDNLSTWNIKSSKLDKGIYSNKVQSYNDAQNECIQEIIKLIENEQ